MSTKYCEFYQLLAYSRYIYESSQELSSYACESEISKQKSLEDFTSQKKGPGLAAEGPSYEENCCMLRFCFLRG